MNEYVNLTLENIDKEHICCAIGDPKHQVGVDNKKEWIKSKLNDYDKFLNETYTLKELNELLLIDFDENLKKELLFNTKNLENNIEKLR